LYECKQKLKLPQPNSFQHVDAQPFLLLDIEKANGVSIPNYAQGK
jgi:hypothetical protein